MFAFQQEEAVPDFVALAKGMTGGFMPLAATLTREAIFEGFGAETFYYGHSFCGHQLGCAAALASLRVFQEEDVLAALQPKIARLAERLERLRANPHVREVRQCGFIAGIELGGRGGVPLDPALLARLGPLQVRARKVVEGILAGLHRSPNHGQSVEFAEHKEYAPGDEIKHIDWRAFGKTDRAASLAFLRRRVLSSISENFLASPSASLA